MKDPDYLIVGAGIFGLTLAERLSSVGKKVLLIDKRPHIGGNCYSEFDQETGIECHKYGAHLFHTSDEEVWAYVTRFTEFTNYVHHVYTTHNGEVFPLPINLGTINQFFHSALTPDEARAKIAGQAKNWRASRKPSENSENSPKKSSEDYSRNLPTASPESLSSDPDQPQNLREQGISLIGEPLFEAFIMNYTAKQWQTPAEELSPEIIKRLPVRFNYDNRYFNNTHEGLPKNGYESWFKNMLKSDLIEVRLSCDYFEDAEIAKIKDHVKTIYTGPIDRFFDFKFGPLTWRSLKFEKEIKSVDDFQGCPVMNYADLDAPYTRIHEFKHFHPERHENAYAEGSNKTVIVREYSKTWQPGDEPYYPVNTAEDRVKLAQYQTLAADRPNIIFGGRLGEYAYYDMDKTFASALKKFRELEG